MKPGPCQDDSQAPVVPAALQTMQRYWWLWDRQRAGKVNDFSPTWRSWIDGKPLNVGHRWHYSVFEKPYGHHRSPRYAYFVVHMGNSSSCFTLLLSVAQEGVGIAIMAGPLVPPGRSLLPSCRVRISEKDGGGKSH